MAPHLPETVSLRAALGDPGSADLQVPASQRGSCATGATCPQSHMYLKIKQGFSIPLCSGAMKVGCVNKSSFATGLTNIVQGTEGSRSLCLRLVFQWLPMQGCNVNHGGCS